MLHGYGSNEEDLFSFASELPDKFFIISVRAPFPLEPYGNAWYAIYFDAEKGKFNNVQQANEAVELVSNFIDEAISAYNLNDKNVTLLGFSQGAILSYGISLSYPEKVKNCIALSGYIDRDILPEDLTKNNYSQLDFYCSHGTADQVIPIEWARKSKPFLDNLKIKNIFSEFPVGHGVAPQNFFEMKSWLEQRL